MPRSSLTNGASLCNRSRSSPQAGLNVQSLIQMLPWSHSTKRTQGSNSCIHKVGKGRQATWSTTSLHDMISDTPIPLVRKWPIIPYLAKMAISKGMAFVHFSGAHSAKRGGHGSMADGQHAHIVGRGGQDGGASRAQNMCHTARPEVRRRAVRDGAATL